jgi:hypothetical protein
LIGHFGTPILPLYGKGSETGLREICAWASSAA